MSSGEGVTGAGSSRPSSYLDAWQHSSTGRDMSRCLVSLGREHSEMMLDYGEHYPGAAHEQSFHSEVLRSCCSMATNQAQRSRPPQGAVPYIAQSQTIMKGQHPQSTLPLWSAVGFLVLPIHTCIQPSKYPSILSLRPIYHMAISGLSM